MFTGAEGSKDRWEVINLYRVFFVLSLAVNIVFVCLAATNKIPYVTQRKAAFALGNIMASVMIRNEVVLFGLYWLVVRLFSEWPPLWFRDFLTSSLLQIGGFHSGLAMASLMWIVYVIITLGQHAAFTQTGVIVIASVLGAFIAISILAAFPLVRFFHHNVFEMVHRFSGWSALAALWIFEVLADNYNAHTRTYEVTIKHFIQHQDFWFCIVTTYLILQPWLMTTRVQVETIVPSPKVCLLKYKGGVKPGILGRISRKPLLEWHAFGIISEGPQSGVHYMLVTALGDFTRGLIEDPPKEVYTRRFKFVGLPYCVPLYRKGLAVATGSGLGITLSVSLQSDDRFHLIWVARDMENCVGSIIMDMLRRADQKRLHLYDTIETGRPDLPRLVVDMAREIGAEVVFVTSNRQGSRSVVKACREAHISCFSPIWDS